MREDSYAEKVAGEARTFRHPPSPLQVEVNLVLKASTWLMIPLAVVLIFALQARSTPLHEAAQTATAGPDHADPRGARAADERHPRGRRGAARQAGHARPADERDRGAGRGRHDLRRQDRDADHGELELVAVEVADPSEASGAERALARFAASAGERNRTLEAIAESYPATGERVRAEVPFSSEWKWSGLTLRARRELRARAPRTS